VARRAARRAPAALGGMAAAHAPGGASASCSGSVSGIACDLCGGPRVDEAWLKAFGVVWCPSCKKGDCLISKSKAKVCPGRRHGAGGSEEAGPQWRRDPNYWPTSRWPLAALKCVAFRGGAGLVSLLVGGGGPCPPITPPPAACWQAQYLLGDADLQRLGTLEKPNPQHPSWTAMRMYLHSQVGGVTVPAAYIAATSQDQALTNQHTRCVLLVREAGAAPLFCDTESDSMCATHTHLP
jgi:hypothetical protein